MEKLSAEELVVAGSLSGGLGYWIDGVVEPDQRNGLAEPSLVWDHQARELLPTLPPRRESLALMLKQLANCAEAEAGARFERIARAYGPFQLCEHGLPFTHDRACYPTHAEPLPGHTSSWLHRKMA